MLSEEERAAPPLLTFEDDDVDLLYASDVDVARATVTSETKSEAEKKAANRAAFDEFLKDVAEKERIEQSTTPLAGQYGCDNTAKIIDNVRDYQQELFERAKEENVIAVLDTGSGKTLIACLLIRQMLSQEVLDRSKGRPPRIIFFLVNSVHLVRQQASVLANNLPTPPAALHGSGKDDLWKKINWEQIFDNSTVVVCTADILNQCLMHSYLSIYQISLIVFDECHHAKKGHAYARIILDYYLRSDPARARPKIFGMTASPVQAKSDIRKAAESLETLLHAKIVTTASMSVHEHAPRARNEEWEYDRLRIPHETDLLRQIKALCNLEELQKHFSFARDATSTLGSWAADEIWRYIFSEKESVAMIKRLEQTAAYQELNSTSDRQREIRTIEAAAFVVQQHLFEEPSTSSRILSSKVLKLASELTHRHSVNPDLRSMVFVDQRWTAELLADCFARLNIRNLRPTTLLGINQPSQASKLASYQSNIQEKVIEHFEAGIVNCVFATSVGEEGIDVPQCSLVIRFDLFKTPIQYMQSRGRARMQNSVYAMMLEQDNVTHRYNVDYAIESEEYIKEFCARLPPDRILGSGDSRLARLIAKEAGNKTFETSSGATCSFNNSLLILSRYASSLQYGGATTSGVSYDLDIKDKLFRYRVQLPNGSEGSGVKGELKSNKSLAKRSAAWECCYLLRKARLLDENLDSVYVRIRPENANAHLAVSNTQEQYDMKLKPTAWKSDGTVPSTLYAALVHFKAESTLRRPLRSLVVFTRNSLPQIPRFPIFLEDNVETDVIFMGIHSALPVDPNLLDLLTSYTLAGIFADIFNKEYGHDSTRMSYWLAPSLLQQGDILPGRFELLVDMQELLAVRSGRIKWKGEMSPDLWCNKFLVDPLNGLYHYMTGVIVPGATISSPVPLSAMKVARKGKADVLDFTNSLWRQSKARNTDIWDVHQPVLTAELFSGRRGFLDKATEVELATTSVPCHIVPQPLLMSQLSTGFAASCLVWPAILHRLEAYMIVLEAFAKLDLEVPADLALEAFTKSGDNNDDESQTHSDSLRGMGKNYERLEFIGDSLLKMTTTLAVFCRKPKADELGMHVARMMMLCNANLFNVATDESLQLYRYARTSGFNRATWYPEDLVLLKGRGAKNPPVPVSHQTVKHKLGQKTIADISEAIIGACLVATRHYPNKFDMGLKAITKLVRSEDHQINAWSEIPALYKVPVWQEQMNDPIALDLASKVEQAVSTGYVFRYPRLLRSAFTHTSDTNSPIPDYERLEFLGDAVLDMVCINWMFNKYEDKNPQWLTEHKMAMVSNKFLAALAVTLDFDKFMIASTVSLLGQISGYARKVREVWGLGKENIRRDFWTEIDNPPKALSDLVESYIGAIIVDSGFDYSRAEQFFEKHILWFFEDIDLYAGFANRHPTSYLTKKLTNEYGCMNYEILCSKPRAGQIEVSITAAVMVHGRVLAKSTGTSARYARVRASKECLNVLDGVPISDFRQRYGCYCRHTKDGVTSFQEVS